MNHSEKYKSELLNSVIPFWQNKSLDRQFGGYFTCLTRDGSVFDTDKFIWLQGREAWTFAMLYNKVEKREDWLAASKHGIEFLEKYGCDEDLNFYFSVTREGKPLISPYNIFSDCFACMAYAQYGLASGNEKYLKLSKKIFENIERKENNPKRHWEKSTGIRPLENFALPMILCNLALELETVLSKEKVDETINRCSKLVLEKFLDKETGLILENISPTGEKLNTFEGRLINPGHGIEAMWFIMDIGMRLNDRNMINTAISTTTTILEYSWDKHYQGIFYFMDSKGFPPQQLEHDQKLWWVHLETLVALSKAYRISNEQSIWNWFLKVEEYTWKHFRDNEYPEWYGYLNRRGEVLLPLKGGKWKGCFHVPRAMYQCWQELEKAGV